MNKFERRSPFTTLNDLIPQYVIHDNEYILFLVLMILTLGKTTTGRVNCLLINTLILFNLFSHVYEPSHTELCTERSNTVD